MPRLFCLVLVLIFASSLLPAAEGAPRLPKNSFTVIELFTSEGCSSCPPADKAINNLVKQARAKKLPIFPIAFHVDYWDKLKTHHGVWKDPYSQHAFTKYQKEYANKKPMPGRKGMLVTPQLLVDGAHLVNGQFNPQKLLSKKREHSVKGTVEKTAEGLKVAYECSGNPADTMICVALVERGIKSKITAGENHGKELVHENVVRSFHRVALADVKGEATLKIPEELNLKKSSVLLYMQNHKTMDIFAASQVDSKKFADATKGAILDIKCKDGVCAVPISQVPDKEQVEE